MKRSTRYELTVIDTNYLLARRKFFALRQALFGQWVRRTSAARTSLSAARQKERIPFPDRIRTASEQFAVAWIENNWPVSEVARRFHSASQAEDFLRGYVRDNPTQAERVHVLPEFEVAL